ncbi:MAG: PAS domain S-box protein, partial [Gemmatimonadota bacterium]|nr:PAS domain S-box protein [Gemmatimonadota bacterium]
MKSRNLEGNRTMREPPSGDARLRAIVDRVADGVLVLDEDGVIRFANPAAETLFGRTRAELLGAPYGFPVVAGETTEIDILRKGGDPVTAELRVVETEWEGENAYLISLRDITDRKRAEEHARELTREQAIRAQAEAEEERFRRLAEEKTRLAEENAQLYERAEEANRAKSEFLAVMSHELRTPLNVITGYTELIESGVSGTVSDTQRDQLTRIRASSRHLLELVDDILTFSRLDSGRDVVHPKSIDFFDLAREAAALSRPLVEQKGLSLDVDTPDGHCRGETDPVKLRQILL